MGSTEGLSRGLDVTNTVAAISVPVGTETLGRIMDVLGNPIDEKGEDRRRLVCQFTAQHRRLERLRRQSFDRY